VSAFKADSPTFIVLKNDPQFKYIPEVIDDSGIKKCYKFLFSNRVYSVLMKGNKTQNCLVGEY
jgi:hypothetical protein